MRVHHDIMLSRNRSTIVQTIQTEREAHPGAAPFAYFYCARDVAEPQRSDPCEVLRALVKQLSRSTANGPILQPTAQKYEEKKRQADEDALPPLKLTAEECTGLILALTTTNPATIVIDAFDECQSAQRHVLLTALDTIISDSRNVVKVLISSRDEEDIVTHLRDCSNIYIEPKDNAIDIERFVRIELNKAIQRRTLLNGRVSSSLQEEIIATLTAGAQGM
jgi:hypothetical protein